MDLFTCPRHYEHMKKRHHGLSQNCNLLKGHYQSDSDNSEEGTCERPDSDSELFDFSSNALAESKSKLPFSSESVKPDDEGGGTSVMVGVASVNEGVASVVVGVAAVVVGVVLASVDRIHHLQ